MSPTTHCTLALLITVACVVPSGCDTSAEPADGAAKPAAEKPDAKKADEKPDEKKADEKKTDAEVGNKPLAKNPDEPAVEEPEVDAKPTQLATEAGSLIESASLELDSPRKMIPVHAKVQGVVGTLEEKYNNIFLHVVCDIGGRRYAEIERELDPKSGEAFEMDDKLFGGVYWGSEGPLGDCDAWLTIRENLSPPQYRESLIAAACRRDEAWTTKGCPGLPEIEAPQPIGESPAEVEMVRGRPFEWKKGWGLKALLDYQVNQHIHPDYELGATTRCTVGKESSEYWSRTPSIKLADIEPGQRARGFVMISPSDEALSTKPEQCEVETAIRHRRDKKDIHPLQTFCWTPEEIKTGECGTA